MRALIISDITYCETDVWGLKAEPDLIADKYFVRQLNFARNSKSYDYYPLNFSMLLCK